MLACFYICNQAVTIADLAVIDYLLVKFCKEYEVLYGSDHITPNMHMHGHPVASMKEFGPVYNFWLFSFERCLHGSKPNNKKVIDIRIIRRFYRDQHVFNVPHLAEHRPQFEEVFKLLDHVNQPGELGMSTKNIELLMPLLFSKKGSID